MIMPFARKIAVIGLQYDVNAWSTKKQVLLTYQLDVAYT